MNIAKIKPIRDCKNNPLIYFDPTGHDSVEIGSFGQVIVRKSSGVIEYDSNAPTGLELAGRFGYGFVAQASQTVWHSTPIPGAIDVVKDMLAYC